MRIPDNVKMIEIPYEVFGTRSSLNPMLLWDDQNVVLIDTGMATNVAQIREGFKDAGFSFDNLTAIILTHQDLDHVGGLAEILKECGEHTKLYAHELDKPYIEGRLPLIKTSPQAMSGLLSSLPEEKRQEILKSMEYTPIAQVDHTVDDQERLPYCGGITVIHTPGHTAGHISLYLEQSKLLIAADALTCKDGMLRGPVPQTTLDMNAANRSIEKLLDYDIEAVICYHGGMSGVDVRDQLEKLVNQQ
ncbi:MBL fold metallo-hydrolase [Cohnella herbarum]|uniref:MBL fold metallo-hydrolase n=1 Tax=Cohnella herbarum TaxID=2728023 RepID=A0A7Z2VHV8_9BACL|nr:MBL fold metallo-hydrolase [Cohnella herbarum]QJD83508.1 MBL fold metallo-hydrolase [Cohnella herbarum]